MSRTLLNVLLIFLIGLIFLTNKECSVYAANQSIETDTSRLIQIESDLAKEKGMEILVQYKPGLRDKRSLSSTSKSLIKKTVSVGPDMLIVNPQTEGESSRLIEEIRKDDAVLHIESNRKHKLYTVPNDPGYAKQWGLKTIMAEEAWTDMPSSKKTVIVAVLDSGIELSHSDLKDCVMPGGYNFISGSDYVYDINGHGTAVSGVIAAKINNRLGIAGVVGTADVKILPLQVANYAGESYISDVIEAIDYTIAKGVDVINISMGSNTYSGLENAAVQRAIQAGVIIVASAGNDGDSTYCYPASYDNVLSVGSIDWTETVSEFSTHNNKVGVVAPGENIYSCYLHNSYRDENGTSFSAPMVTGMAAVLRAINPSIKNKDVINIIETTAEDRGTLGRDSRYGYGVVNMDAAVKKASYISVEKISLEPIDLQLVIGETKTLVAEVLPIEASNQVLNWVSDNPSVAQVDAQGIVTAVGTGQALITAISVDGGKTANCTVSVKEEDFRGILWASKDSVLPDKKWKIVFNAPLGENTVLEGAIYVVDNQGTWIPIEITIGNERREVLVGSKVPYELGKIYYLMISNSIFSESGKFLVGTVKMKFTIQAN
ncbi:MAG: hypothetical protein APF81_02000 [Desulfosporosinus sp. BRH_c37]|nr:MAG: hypothetical protein APF81_02000 [Desulfosporosinus sp. BRH_c37]